jgi:hypothetical protein
VLRGGLDENGTLWRWTDGKPPRREHEGVTAFRIGAIGEMVMRGDEFQFVWQEPKGDVIYDFKDLGKVVDFDLDFWGSGCVLSDEGRVQCWDRAYDANLPYDVPGRFRSIDVGQDHACGIDLEGLLRCWGKRNHRGQIGDGSLRPKLEPAFIAPH